MRKKARLARIVEWLRKRPIAAFLGGLGTLFGIWQGVIFVKNEFFPASPHIVSVERREQRQQTAITSQSGKPQGALKGRARSNSNHDRQQPPGVDFVATVENPTDEAAEFVSVSFRVESPRRAHLRAHYRVHYARKSAELLEPEVLYRIPLSCRPGSQVHKLQPPLKVEPKEIAIIDFRAPAGDYPCDVYVSLTTSGGASHEVEVQRPADRAQNAIAVGTYPNTPDQR